uniref:DNA topoisomerase n=1 Tax=Klebsiella aerogenes TaxID=548 RepID=P71196_KLEAE|nr:TraE [Klebsiella aerogenes]
MRLFIAEKPSVAKAIAGELGATGKGDGFIECGTDKVTWCFGHMLEQADPDEYTPDDVPRGQSGKKVWRVDELPIIPESWILKPKDDAKKQLAVIGKLLKEAKEIVNAGDPDREGQLLVDEVLEHFRNSKPVRRFWVSAQDSVSVKRGLAALKENTTYAGWADAARGRQRADWLIGMNLSRAYTLRAQRGGSRALLTVGRVQTPTLALVVARDREIEAFKAVPYHTIRAVVQHAGGSFAAAWKAKEDQAGLYSEGRLVDTAVADALVAAVKGQPGTIAAYKQEAKKQNQPLAFALSDITALASAKFGYSAEDVLNTCQALYETHKLTCTRAPTAPTCRSRSTPTRRACWRRSSTSTPTGRPGRWCRSAYQVQDVGRLEDHRAPRHRADHAEGQQGRPQRARAQHLRPDRARLPGAVLPAARVHADHRGRSRFAGENFAASGKVVTRNGWRDVYSQADEEGEKDEDDDSGTQALPSMAQGDAVTCTDATRKDAKTKPPARFTEGTLIRAMENIHKFVSDAEHKKMLREGDGIGTSATRASIISELKRREFLAVKGKQIISTTLGRSVIDALPEVVKSPVLTALYERMLKGVEQGTAALDAFITKQETFIRDQVAKANSGAVTIAGGKEAAPVSSLHKCMACGSGLSRRPSKKKGQFWWGCSNFPTCKQTYPDLKGRPDYSKGRNGQASE